jgi:aldehyde dehydrogenase (NAD+)
MNVYFMSGNGTGRQESESAIQNEKSQNKIYIREANMTIRQIIQAQRQYFASGATREVSFRIEQMRKLEQALEQHEPALLQALAQDLAKPALEAYLSEIGQVRAEIRYAQRRFKRWVRPQRRATVMANKPGRSYVLAEPYGTVLIMGPWNYPVNLLLSPFIGAIAAGNTAILKPSELAPAVSTVIITLIQETFDPANVAAIPGDATVAQELLEEPFDYIFFTGSTQVGRIVMEKAARHLTPVTLELGGKSPTLVWPDCDLEVTARRTAWGKFLNAGQTCVTPDYVLAHASIYEAFIERLKKTIASFYGADPKQSRDYGRIVNLKHWERLQGYLSQGRIVFGGQADRDDRYMAPTLLTDVAEEAPLMTEEIFGPILPIIKVTDYEAAKRFINARPKPLALYIFARDQKLIRRFIREVPAGGVCVNDTISHLFGSELPFGGVGDSGMGAYHGKASFDTFSHYKSVLERKTWLDFRMKYPPYKYGLEQIKRILKFIF